MIAESTWRLGERLDSPWNRLYERLRRRLNDRLVTFLLSHLPPSTNENSAASLPRVRALEAGSGTAYASSLLSRRREVGVCVCLDLDEQALREAKRRDADLFAVVGDIRKMPFAKETFSLVFNNSTVEHLNDPVEAVREMRRVCRGEGHVFVGVPYRFGPLWFQPLIRSTTAGRWLGRVFSGRSLRRLLTEAGLAPKHYIRYFWNFFVGAVAVKAPGGKTVRGAET